MRTCVRDASVDGGRLANILSHTLGVLDVKKPLASLEDEVGADSHWKTLAACWMIYVLVALSSIR